MDYHIPEAELDKIGPWSEVKLDIIGKYATAYTTIMSRQQNFTYYYIDAYAGWGTHLSKASGEPVKGSPRLALEVSPPFDEYHFIDIEAKRTETLEELAYGNPSVHIHPGDCNEILVSEILPKVKYEEFRRALCLIDPYGLQLDWKVIERAGSMGTIEIFLNFPIMDMNRNVLRRNPEEVTPSQKARLTRYWGDETWRDAAYDTTQSLFHWEEKTSNEAVVEAFRERLKKVAGFKYVPEPLAMRNTIGAVVYYLFFASQKPVADHIVREIFSKYRGTRN